MKIFNSLSSRTQTPVFSLQFIQLLRFATLFFISIAFAKSNYSIADIGIYEKFLYFAGALSFFWTNGIIQAFLSLFNKQTSEKEQLKLIANSLFLSAFFSILIFGLVILFEHGFAQFFINSQQIPYRTLFLIYLLLSPLTFFIEYFYLVKKQYQNIYRYGIGTYLLQLVLLVVPAFIYDKLEYSLNGLVIISFIRVIWLLLVLKGVPLTFFSLQHIVELIKTSAPLILSSFIAGSIPYVDGVLVAMNYDDTVFAVYRYGARELPISVLLANAFSNAMIPVINSSSNITPLLYEIKRKSLQLMHVLFPVSMVLLVVSSFLFKVIFNPQFMESSHIFNVMLLLIIPRMMFPQTILIANRFNKYTLIASLSEWLTKVVCSILLLHVWGVFGIAMATFVAFIVEKFILMYFVRQRLQITPSEYIPLKWLLFYSALIFIIFVLVEYPLLFNLCAE